MSLFGLWSKKSGYGRAAAGQRRSSVLVWLDKSVTGLAEAQKADVYTYIAQAHDDSPDIFVAGPDARRRKQVTTTNAFQSKFAWSTERDRRLQDGQGAAGCKGRSTTPPATRRVNATR